jgi:hypothetical protein
MQPLDQFSCRRLGFLGLEPVVLLIVPAMTLASITLAGRLDSWKPVQQLPSGGSSRP